MWEETSGRPHDVVRRRLPGGAAIRGSPDLSVEIRGATMRWGNIGGLL
jgi:hypothetical protein